jgi:T4 RnlA family RNA ligase
MNSWNPIFNVVIKIKYDYIKTYGSIDTYVFEDWLGRLNKKEYNDIFECLQFNQDENYILIRYGLAEMQHGMWEDTNSIYRECRSVVIDLKNENLVLTPFRKFFNLNEVEENKLDLVAKRMQAAKVVEVSDKLDGSMQSARWYRGKVFMSGSMAINKNSSWRLEEGYQMLTTNHLNMIMDNPDYTFIFEYISLKDAHVVIYQTEQEALHLIGIRNVLNGDQLAYSKVIDIANKYHVPVVRMESLTLDQMLEGMKTYKSHEKEGWILNIDGHYIKLKCDDYVHIHRILDKVSSANVVIQAIAEGKYDDVISKIPDRYKERINKLAKLIYEYIADSRNNVNELYKDAPKTSRKEFMIWVESNVSQDLKHFVRNKYLGNEINFLKKGVAGYKKLKELGIDEKYSALFFNEEVA